LARCDFCLDGFRSLNTSRILKFEKTSVPDQDPDSKILEMSLRPPLTNIGSESKTNQRMSNLQYCTFNVCFVQLAFERGAFSFKCRDIFQRFYDCKFDSCYKQVRRSLKNYEMLNNIHHYAGRAAEQSVK